MTSPDDATDRVGVTVRCQENASVGVPLCDRFSFDADCVHYAVSGWSASLTTWLEAGDQMGFPAAGIGHFLAGEQQ